MSDTNPAKFRAEMKTYLEKAEKTPVRIHRRSGESFILMNEKTFVGLQSEIISLQRRLLGMSQIVGGESQEHIPGSEDIETRLSRLKSPTPKKKRA